MVSDLRIATRRSPLALAQAHRVANRLAEAHPGLSVELVEVSTAGDRDRVSSIAELTELGAFVRAVQDAVVEGRAIPMPEDILITRPGPRIVDGLEAMARAIHPEAFA